MPKISRRNYRLAKAGKELSPFYNSGIILETVHNYLNENSSASIVQSLEANAFLSNASPTDTENWASVNSSNSDMFCGSDLDLYELEPEHVGDLLEYKFAKNTSVQNDDKTLSESLQIWAIKNNITHCASGPPEKNRFVTALSLNFCRVVVVIPLHILPDTYSKNIFPESYMSEILKKLTLMRANILQLNEDIQNVIKERNAPVEENDNFLNSFEFPISSVECLEVEMNEYLQDGTKFNRAIKDLVKLGGSTTYDFMKRCLQQIITNSLAETYSYYGAKLKRPFKNLKLNQVLLRAAEMHNNSDQKEAEEAIKKWLRRAKERQNTKKNT